METPHPRSETQKYEEQDHELVLGFLVEYLNSIKDLNELRTKVASIKKIVERAEEHITIIELQSCECFCHRNVKSVPGLCSFCGCESLT